MMAAFARVFQRLGWEALANKIARIGVTDAVGDGLHRGPARPGEIARALDELGARRYSLNVDLARMARDGLIVKELTHIADRCVPSTGSPNSVRNLPNTPRPLWRGSININRRSRLPAKEI